MNKNILIVVFLSFFFYSCLPIHKAIFNANSVCRNTYVEGNQSDFLLLKDGTIIGGKNADLKLGLFVREHFELDGRKFKVNSVKAYMKDNVYYSGVTGDYAKRIIHGKLNVYVCDHFWSVYTDKGIRTGTITRYYTQVGDSAQLVELRNYQELKKMLFDCQNAYKMVDMQDSELRNIVTKDCSYLTSVFNIYNNCK